MMENFTPHPDCSAITWRELKYAYDNRIDSGLLIQLDADGNELDSDIVHFPIEPYLPTYEILVKMTHDANRGLALKMHNRRVRERPSQASPRR